MKLNKIGKWLLLFLGVTTLTSIIANKTEGFTKNPFKEEIKDVNTDNENLLSFYIEGIEYKFEEGMTWAEWCESKYNEVSIPSINGNYKDFRIWCDDEYFVYYSYYDINNDYENFIDIGIPNELIINNHNYKLK